MVQGNNIHEEKSFTRQNNDPLIKNIIYFAYISITQFKILFYYLVISVSSARIASSVQVPINSELKKLKGAGENQGVYAV